jgi:hypothetical protein
MQVRLLQLSDFYRKSSFAGRSLQARLLEGKKEIASHSYSSTITAAVDNVSSYLSNS